MEKPTPAKPTKLRQAIDRAIIRMQTEAAASEAQASDRVAPIPPRPLQPREIELQLNSSLDSVLAADNKPEETLEIDPEHAPDSSELQAALSDVWPVPPQQPPKPEPPLDTRDRRYLAAAQQAEHRQRDVYPAIERLLEPVTAEELGWNRPKLRRPLAIQAPSIDTPAETVIVVPEQATDLISESTETVFEPAIEARPPKPERVRKPLAADVVAALSPEALPAPELRQPPVSIAIIAGLGWAIVLGWLIWGNIGPQSESTTKILFGAATSSLGIITWAPIQWALRLKALTWRGTVGWLIVLWSLAFIRPPTNLLTSLPDTPLYILFCIGVFLAVSALSIPILYLRQVRYQGNRRERFDLRRTVRQANEIAVFVAMCIVLAAMNVLELISVILLIMILVLSELLLLSLQKT